MRNQPLVREFQTGSPTFVGWEADRRQEKG